MHTNSSLSRQGSPRLPDLPAIRTSPAPALVSSPGPSKGSVPTAALHARANSPPRIPFVVKGKELVPDFRSISSNLRAAGKLQGPPPLEEMSNSQEDMETNNVTTLRRRAPTRDTSRDTHDIEDMYATPARDSVRSRTRFDTHDVDDLYATPPPQSTRAASRYDTHDIEDMYATPAPDPRPLPAPREPSRIREVAERPPRPSDDIVVQLVFEWHNERYPDGKGDEWFSLLEKKMRLIQKRKGGQESRRGRKSLGPNCTRLLSKKERRKIEAEALSFYVP